MEVVMIIYLIYLIFMSWDTQERLKRIEKKLGIKEGEENDEQKG